MSLKYRQQRYGVRLRIWLQHLLTPRNLITTFVVVSLLAVVSPVFLVSFFGSIYAEGTPNPSIKDCIATAVELQSERAELVPVLVSLKCKRVHVYGKNYDQTRTFVKYLDEKLDGVEVIPDFSATDPIKFCQDLAANQIKNAISVSNSVDNIQIAYACDAYKIGIFSVNITEPTFWQQFSSGFGLARLIVQINTTSN